MRVIGYSRRKLETASDIRHVYDAVSSTFDLTDFRFSVDLREHLGIAESFSLDRGFSKLKKDDGVGFFKEHIVSVGIDNQEFGGGYFIYPFSTVQIKTLENCTRQTHEWLRLVEQLTVTLQLEVCYALGDRETAKEYHRTPLGVGIGLIRVFWIMCFGSCYSALIPGCAGQTSFFAREDNAGCKAFVSTKTYNEYCSSPDELFARQRQEIGEDLFNRLPEEPRSGGAEASWLFSPENVFRFIRLLVRERLTNWRQYQARVVPEYYQVRKGAK